jgi:hypothetical protein
MISNRISHFGRIDVHIRNSSDETRSRVQYRVQPSSEFPDIEGRSPQKTAVRTCS